MKFSRAELERAGIGRRTDADVGRALGLSRERVRQLRQVFGVQLVPKAELRRRLQRMRQLVRGRRHSVREIAALAKVSPHTAYNFAKRCGITLPRRTSNPKYTFFELKSALESSSSIAEASRKLGMRTPHSLFQIIRHRGLRGQLQVPNGGKLP